MAVTEQSITVRHPKAFWSSCRPQVVSPTLLPRCPKCGRFEENSTGCTNVFCSTGLKNVQRVLGRETPESGR